jgi:hypothetical protein
MYLDVPEPVEVVEYGAYAADWSHWTVKPGRYPVRWRTIDWRTPEHDETPYWATVTVAAELGNASFVHSDDRRTEIDRQFYPHVLIPDAPALLGEDRRPVAWWREGDFVEG